MKKIYAILVAVIFLISVSAVFAADSSKEIFLGGVKFNVPSNGEFTPDNTGYHTDKFGIDLIQDNSLPDEQNKVKNSSLTKMTLYHRDVLAIYSKSSDDFNVFYFSAGDKLFKASCKEDSDIKKLQDIVKNSPNSTLTTEEFYARLGTNPYSDTFNELDTNHDGKLSIDEFEELTEYIMEDSFWDGYSPEEVIILNLKVLIQTVTDFYLTMNFQIDLDSFSFKKLVLPAIQQLLMHLHY